MISRPFAARRPSLPRAVTVGRAALALALGSLSPACGGKTDPLGTVGSETHFLIECSETCDSGLECIHGVCTSPCSDDAVCASLNPAAICLAEPAAPEPRTCDVPCAVPADCAVLGAGYGCSAGACRAAVEVDTELAATPLPDPFDLLELRRIGDVAPAAGSNCDPRVYMGAYFVDLPARQVSWANCSRMPGTDVYVASVGQWSLLDADSSDLLAAYRELRVNADDACDPGSGIATLDVTVAARRFGYADGEHAGCPITRLGRRGTVVDLTDFYQTLAPLISDRPRGLPRDDSTER